MSNDRPVAHSNAIKFRDGTEYKRNPDGSYRKINKDPSRLNWRERANRAEHAFVQMVEERKQLQNLLLEACMKLEKYGFTCEAGDLKSCKEFRDIMMFARGTPEIVRPPLESMPLDGTRSVKRLHKAGATTEVFLECGHSYEVLPDEVKGVKPNAVMPCPQCAELLMERGMFLHSEKQTNKEADMPEEMKEAPTAGGECEEKKEPCTEPCAKPEGETANAEAPAEEPKADEPKAEAEAEPASE